MADGKIPMKDDCGIFSIMGRITPFTYGEGASSFGALGSLGVGASGIGCAIKEVLPSKIYKSESLAKDGHEYFVNKDGTFSRVFE